MTDLITAEEAQDWLGEDDSPECSCTPCRMARAVIALHAELAQARADAKAAVAVAIEGAAEAIRAEAKVSPYQDGMTVVYQRGLGHGFEAAAQVVERLAPEDAIAEVAKLREQAALSQALVDGAERKVSRVEAERDRLAAELAAANAREAVDADLLLSAYKGLLVLHRVLDKSGLTAGVAAANQITERITAAHPEMPGRASLRAALAQPSTAAGQAHTVIPPERMKMARGCIASAVEELQGMGVKSVSHALSSVFVNIKDAGSFLDPNLAQPGTEGGE